MKIKTVQVNPPIPTRAFDWCAYDEDAPEEGPYGWGKTEREALLEITRILPVPCKKCGFDFWEHSQTSGYRCPNTAGDYEDNNYTPK